AFAALQIIGARRSNRTLRNTRRRSRRHADLYVVQRNAGITFACTLTLALEVTHFIASRNILPADFRSETLRRKTRTSPRIALQRRAIAARITFATGQTALPQTIQILRTRRAITDAVDKITDLIHHAAA